MILAALSFVFAAWLVQQMAELPGIYWLLSASCTAMLILLLQYQPRFARYACRQRMIRAALLSLSTFLFGLCWASGLALWRMSDALPHVWEQKTISVIGVVASLPQPTERGVRFRFDVEKILTHDAVVPRHISLNQYFFNNNDTSAAANYSSRHAPPLSLTVPQHSNFKAGQRWQLEVRLKRPHGTQNPHGFDFESWALSENIRASGSIKNSGSNRLLQQFVWRPSYIIEHLRENVRQRIARVLADKPYTGIIQALVMGDDSQIRQDDWQVFLRTGTTHLMSISGLHITMLAGLAYACAAFIWRRCPQLVLRLPARKAATAAAVLAALLYALIAGFSVPSQRTFYMLLVFALAMWSGRQLVISQVLALALCVVVVLDPWAVTAPGFWLSFGAVAILAYALGARVRPAHWLQAALQTQWAVTIGMLPLLLLLFNQTSIISPLANAVAIPLISFVVTPLALLGSFLPFDSALHLSYQALNLGMLALNWCNQLPMAVWQQQAMPVWTFFPAMLGVLWLLLPRGFPLRWLGLFGFMPMLFSSPPRPSLGEMQVTVLDVGQGLSVVVQTATHTLLYDAGPQYNTQSDAGSRIVLPFLRGSGVSKLDGFIVSHDDLDHSGGLASVLAQMPVSWLASSYKVNLKIPEKSLKIQCMAGQRWVWDQVQFEVLYPNLDSYSDARLKDNDRSCVVKITSHAGTMLLTGDIEKKAERNLLAVAAASAAGKLQSDVITVPHHGSKTSSSLAFIAAVAPQVSITTNGYLNRFGHPKPQVMQRYHDAGSLRYRSDYNGAVQIRFMYQQNQPRIVVDNWRSQYKRYWHEDLQQYALTSKNLLN
jgi:competence protein ComEC